MSDLYRCLATSDHWAARFIRAVYRWKQRVSVPAPRLIVRPLLWAVLAVRAGYYFWMRVLVCEPLFKAYCKTYGRGLHTGVFLHWVQGNGDIIIGDDVLMDGKTSIGFAAQFVDRPSLHVGNGTFIGHDCSFNIARSIQIGNHVLMSVGVRISDYDGHPTDATERRANKPTPPELVKPVVIGDDVWIGAHAMILRGVTIGDRSIVGAGAVVTRNVPPDVVVVGNPARIVKQLADQRCTDGAQSA
jgi:acetyltransferase-like isoleucine patch superfamily enzyme